MRWDVSTAQIHLIMPTKSKMLVLKLQTTRAIVDSVQPKSLTTITTAAELSASAQSSLQLGICLPNGLKGLSEILWGKHKSGRGYFNNYASETNSLPTTSSSVPASKTNLEIMHERNKKGWFIFSFIYSANNDVSSKSVILTAIVWNP